MARGHRTKRGSIKQSVARQAENTLRGGKTPKFDQIRQRHFWSSYFFAPDSRGYVNAGRYTLFTTPVGSNGQGFPSGTVITERESNWKSQNRVPDNQNFQIEELGVGVLSAAFAAAALLPEAGSPAITQPSVYGLSNFFQSSVLSITYLTNSVPLGLLADFAQASGPGQFGIDAPIADSDLNIAAINGFAAPALRRKFKIPILLGKGETFNLTIEVPRPTYVGFGGSTYWPFLVRTDFWATESFTEKA